MPNVAHLLFAWSPLGVSRPKTSSVWGYRHATHACDTAACDTAVAVSLGTGTQVHDIAARPPSQLPILPTIPTILLCLVMCTTHCIPSAHILQCLFRYPWQAHSNSSPGACRA